MGEPTVPEDVCKALGARKNSIRLRAHTTEWKPHVFLRRVDLDLDSDEEEEANARHIAYYGLYAAKQINVKPGKEILFAIPGLGLDGQSLVFEVKTKGEGDEDEDIEGFQDDNFHPKKRKGWIRPQYDATVLANFVPQRIPIYADAAVQVELECTDASSQTIPPPETPPPPVVLKKDAQIQLSLPSPPATCEMAIQAEVPAQAEGVPAGSNVIGGSIEQPVDEDDNDDFCPPGLSISHSVVPAISLSRSVIEISESREATPMDIESPPGTPPPTDAHSQTSSTVVGSEIPSSPAPKLKDAVTSFDKAPTAGVIVAIPRTVSRLPPSQISVASPSAAAAAALNSTPSAPIDSVASSTLVRPQLSAWSPVDIASKPVLAPALSTVKPATAPIDVDTMAPVTQSRTLTQVKSESVDADTPKERSKSSSEDVLKPPEGEHVELLASSSRDPCWLINAPWRHGLLVEVQHSLPAPPSKGYLDGEREGKRAVVIFFNFFGSVPSPDTMAKVCFLDDGFVSFIPIKYILPVPPSTPGEYAVTIQGPAAGVTVKTLEAQPHRNWLEWGSGPPNGFLQDQAPQHPLQPKEFWDRPQKAVNGFEADIQLASKVSLGKPITLPPKPSPPRVPTASAFTLPSKPNKSPSDAKVEPPSTPDHVPHASKYAPLPDQSLAFATSTSASSLPASLVYLEPVVPEVVAMPGWIPPMDAALPARPTASQHGPALGKRKRRNGRKKDRRNVPGLPPVTGDAYRPGYDRNPDRSYDYNDETYHLGYHVGGVVPPPQYGDSYRPSYADDFASPRASHYTPRHSTHDHYAPGDPSKSRSMSRDHGEEDIASSREPSPAVNERRPIPDPMEALETSQHSSKSYDDDLLPWPVLKPSHSVPVLAEDGTPLELKEVTFSPSGKMLAVCCGDSIVRVFDAAGRSDPFMLRHEWPVTSVAWLDGAAGLMTIGNSGVITKWTPLMSQAPVRWISAKVHDTKSQDPVAFAFSNGRVAVVFPKDGVKMWEWGKGIWAELRGIKRSGVTAIKFIHDGSALLGATVDGVVWYCEVPNGTMRATTFLKRKILSLNIHPSGTRALVSLDNGHVHIISTPTKGKLGDQEKAFQMDKTPTGVPILFSASAAFVGHGDEILFGTAEHCLLLWSRADSKLLAGLRIVGDDDVDVVANQSNAGDGLGCVVAATRGKLFWWPQPDLSEIAADHPPAKRAKLD